MYHCLRKLIHLTSTTIESSKYAFSKIFTSILNKRISKWIDDNTIVSDAQYGFMACRSTVDAIFILNAFVNKALNDKGRLYCGLLTLRKRLTV